MAQKNDPTHQANAKLFAAWVEGRLQSSEPSPEPAEAMPAPGYPCLPDPGGPLYDSNAYWGTPEQQFVEWMHRTDPLAFDPRKDKDGFIRII